MVEDMLLCISSSGNSFNTVSVGVERSRRSTLEPKTNELIRKRARTIARITKNFISASLEIVSCSGGILRDSFLSRSILDEFFYFFKCIIKIRQLFFLCDSKVLEEFQCGLIAVASLTGYFSTLYQSTNKKIAQNETGIYSADVINLTAGNRASVENDRESLETGPSEFSGEFLFLDFFY